MMLANVVKFRPGVTIDFARRVAVIADFTRLPGVGVAYAELLEAAGLDLRRLRSTEPTEILYLLDSLRGAKGLSDSRPSLERVEGWCAAAHRLVPLVSR